MRNKVTDCLRRRRGMTLVEIVAGLAVLGLLALLLSTVFVTGVNVVGRQAQQKKANAEAAGGVEQAAAGETSEADASADKTDGSFSIRFGGETVEVPGSYYENQENGYDRSFRYFVPQS